jgi:hypothetical protein
MSAFNWVIFELTCPVCHMNGIIQAQTHIAASYNGDSTGRFHDRKYHIGERMAWWPPDDPNYADWCNNGQCIQADRAREACYASCMSSGCKLCVVLEFVSLVPIRVIELLAEVDWPEGYGR